ncbi:MAG: TetR/AcrR family transcriptional regulator [Actinomycetota bacterium]
MEQTRRRIAAATLELHATVGPAHTTVSAVADRAGVERATVYRHFPDELSLFRACVTHGLEIRPGPDPSGWAGIADPEERLRTGLRELYGYYQRNESLWANVTRDLPLLPALQQANAEAGVFDWFGAIRETLLRPWQVRGRRRELLRAAIGHAVEFTSWYSLARRQGLGDEGAVDAMAAMVRCLMASAS